MSYARRYIDVSFIGGTGNVRFNARGKYALRTSARILHAGGFNQGELALELRGLSLDHINQLSTFGTRIHPNYNYQIIVEAGDEQNGMSTVFAGGIQQAWADMKAMPDVPFHVIASGGGQAVTARTEPTTYEGPTDAPMMLEKLAKQCGMKFQNHGVQCKIADPYFNGSAWRQMKQIIDAGDFNGYIQDNVLHVWKKDGYRQGDTLFISPQTGMRDYPSFTEYGVQVRTEFRKAIEYGSQMNIQSDITEACGPWRIIRIDYDLQANQPKGSWYAILDGAKVGSPVTKP